MFSKLKEKLRGGDREAAMSELDRENALEQLQHFDTQFLIDDSASMAGARWTEAQDALTGLADKALRHDTDGIEIHFLNAARSHRTATNEEEVRRAFYSVKPAGYTPTGNRLEEILTQYITRLETAKGTETTKSDKVDSSQAAIKPLNLIVITDGEPTDDPESVIIAAARRLDAGHFSLNQVGIQFIQIGNDKKATKALHELDDHLSKANGVRDMVDTRPYKGKKLTSELLIAMLLGGINRRVDNIKKPGQQSK